MAKFELELSVHEKRRLMAMLGSLLSEYKESLQAAERGEVNFESEERKEFIVKETANAVGTLVLVLKQLHDQNPS